MEMMMPREEQKAPSPKSGEVKSQIKPIDKTEALEGLDGLQRQTFRSPEIASPDDISRISSARNPLTDIIANRFKNEPVLGLTPITTKHDSTSQNAPQKLTLTNAELDWLDKGSEHKNPEPPRSQSQERPNSHQVPPTAEIQTYEELEKWIAERSKSKHPELPHSQTPNPFEDTTETATRTHEVTTNSAISSTEHLPLGKESDALSTMSTETDTTLRSQTGFFEKGDKAIIDDKSETASSLESLKIEKNWHGKIQNDSFSQRLEQWFKASRAFWKISKEIYQRLPAILEHQTPTESYNTIRNFRKIAQKGLIRPETYIQGLKDIEINTQHLADQAGQEKSSRYFPRLFGLSTAVIETKRSAIDYRAIRSKLEKLPDNGFGNPYEKRDDLLRMFDKAKKKALRKAWSGFGWNAASLGFEGTFSRNREITSHAYHQWIQNLGERLTQPEEQ